MTWTAPQQGKAWQELNKEAMAERVGHPDALRQGPVPLGVEDRQRLPVGPVRLAGRSATCTSSRSRVTAVAPGDSWLPEPPARSRSGTAPTAEHHTDKEASDVTAYVIRRVLTGLLILVLLSMLTFLLFSALPADPAALTCGKTCTPQIIEANRVRLGLDLPLWQQYVEFVKGIFFGRTYGSGTATFECSAPCLGYSFRRGEEVTPLDPQRPPRHDLPGRGRLRHLDDHRRAARHLRGPAPRSLAGEGHPGRRPRRLLVPLVLHRPAAALLRRHPLAAAAVSRATCRPPRTRCSSSRR